MAVLPLILGPDPVLRTVADPVTDFGEQLEQTVSDMFDTLYERRAVGLGANMVGVTQRIIVVDLQEEGQRNPLVCINPSIISISAETQENEEASLCYPGIAAKVKRANSVSIEYQDRKGTLQELNAQGWLAAVIQHEMEYLDGRCYLDNLSKMKKDRLIKKMQKQLKNQCCSDPNCSSR